MFLEGGLTVSGRGDAIAAIEVKQFCLSFVGFSRMTTGSMVTCLTAVLPVYRPTCSFIRLPNDLSTHPLACVLTYLSTCSPESPTHSAVTLPTHLPPYLLVRQTACLSIHPTRCRVRGKPANLPTKPNKLLMPAPFKRFITACSREFSGDMTQSLPTHRNRRRRNAGFQWGFSRVTHFHISKTRPMLTISRRKEKVSI